MTSALIDHLWQSTLFCAAAWSISLALHSNSAAVRHWLWLLASLKFLVPFSVLYQLGAAAGLPTPVESQPLLFEGAVTVAAPVLSPSLAPFDIAPVLLPALLCLWIGGSLCLALRWLRDWRAANLLSRAARPAPGALPDTVVTDADIEPSVAGVFHPVVLLPAALLGRLSGPQLAAVLAHEREHIARHDNLKAHLHRLVETLFWFHPLVWLIGRRLREERENACDEAVLAFGHERGDYAAGILEVCRHCATVHSRHAVAALAGDLTSRIRQILAGASPVALGFMKAFVLSVVTLLFAVTPLLAGAIDDALRRHVQVEVNARVLWDADVVVSRSGAGADEDTRIVATGTGIEIRNSSLRQLIALAYDVDGKVISGGGGLLDEARYDIRATVAGGVSEPEQFDPAALRAVVTRLLATKFNLELHVNHQCQYPCGPRALETTDPAH
jgi:beta-lactamase regulating signal transducer with metallopeptidase domain